MRISIVLMLLSALAILAALPFAYLAWYFRWERLHASAPSYFGSPLAERRATKQRIRRYSRPVLPLVRWLARSRAAHLSMPVFEHRGVSGPPKVSSPEVFERAARYEPCADDVFVVTQMRCGTTWMQQIVFQIVTRGRGDLSDTGFGHLYRMSPWIDAVTTVQVGEAPLVGERPTRIIKSHLPTALCPYSAAAKYIYVTRHPIQCFASIVDYNRSLLGPFTPSLEVLADWFCSDRMYWQPWPRHVDGWWRWSQTHDNILFVHYEELLKDFPSVLERIARFLGYTLTADETAAVMHRCSFQYMKANEEVFEMAPPTMFSVDGGEYLKRGQDRRSEDVTPAIRSKILEYCRLQLRGAAYPASEYYRDLGSVDRAPS